MHGLRNWGGKGCAGGDAARTTPTSSTLRRYTAMFRHWRNMAVFIDLLSTG